MRRLSEKAFATLAACEKTKRFWGITVDEEGPRIYRFVWSFKIDKNKAKREGYDSTRVNGDVILDDEYPGCPYCGEKRFYVCERCGAVVCWHGSSIVTCPNCRSTGEIEYVETVDIKGGGY